MISPFMLSLWGKIRLELNKDIPAKIFPTPLSMIKRRVVSVHLQGLLYVSVGGFIMVSA